MSRVDFPDSETANILFTVNFTTWHFHFGNEMLSAADNDCIGTWFRASVLYLKGASSSRSLTVLKAITMKFIVAFLVLVAVFNVFASAGSVPATDACRRDICGDDFDELVCASNGEETRYFSGSCRMRQFNSCHDDREILFHFLRMHLSHSNCCFQISRKWPTPTADSIKIVLPSDSERFDTLFQFCKNIKIKIIQKNFKWEFLQKKSSLTLRRFCGDQHSGKIFTVVI